MNEFGKEMKTLNLYYVSLIDNGPKSAEYSCSPPNVSLPMGQQWVDRQHLTTPFNHKIGIQVTQEHLFNYNQVLYGHQSKP